MRVFVSHSSKDASLAAEVCSHIENSGHSCFLAPRDIRSGYEYAEEIINGIDDSDVILLLLSQAANDSPHVLREIERAVSKKKSIIVYRLEEVKLSKSMEYFLMTHQWLNSDGSSNFDDIIQRINEFAVHSPATAAEAPVPAPVAPERSSRRRNTIMIIAAAVILASAGVITGFCLANRAPAEPFSHDLEQQEPAPGMNSSAPQPGSSPEQPSTNEAPQDELQQPVPVFESAAGEPNTPEDNPTPAADDPGSTGAPSPQNPAPQTTTRKPLTTSEAPQESSEPEVIAAQAELGDALMFGTYNGEPIEWRIVRISEDGTQAVVIADDILTMKAYDAAEGGKFNSWDGKEDWNFKSEDIDPDIQRMIRGDNRWEFSNIRTWLNSDRENIVYTDQPPTSQAMAEKRNGYHTEAGFLNDFTKNELSAVIQTEIVTNGTVTEDKVFLLSSSEVEWLYEADVSLYAKPTEAAVAQDASKWYDVNIDAYGIDDHYWWLRDAVPDTACECYYINISYSDRKIVSGNVGLEGYGIRPAMTLDLTSETVKTALENAHGTD